MSPTYAQRQIVADELIRRSIDPIELAGEALTRRAKVIGVRFLATGCASGPVPMMGDGALTIEHLMKQRGIA